jgi:hypothetical protein
MDYSGSYFSIGKSEKCFSVFFKGMEEDFVSACGAAYPVIPLAKAQRTRSSQRRNEGTALSGV